MGVGLALKGDIHVGPVVIAILYQSEQPFYDIQHIERNEEQLSLLGCVDALMINYVLVYP